MRVEFLRLDAHRTSNTIKQRVEWNRLLSPNVIKPIQLTKTQAHTLSLSALSITLTHSYTCTHVHTHPVLLQTQSKGPMLPLLSRASSLVQITGHDVLSMSLAQNARHSHRVLLFTVVSVVGHFANILQQNLSVKFLSSGAKCCSFPWPWAFMGLVWPTVNPEMTFWNNLRFLISLYVMNEAWIW